MKGLKQRLKRPTANNSPLSKDTTWTHQDQRVWQAVAGNQPAKVAAKLSKHGDVDVNRIYPNVGYSVVHYAAAKGLDDCLNILLAHKADASAQDITGATPLHAAARYGHRGTTSKLLASRSIKVNLSDKNQCTALHFAAFEGHVECITLIAEVPDVDLNCTDKDGRTPLMVAAAMGRIEVCTELVERECDIHHRDNELGHTALTLAADSGHAGVVRLLSDCGANHALALYDGRTALTLAKQKDRRSVIDALHVVQLTEAANKSSNGPRLSTSSNKYKPEDSAIKKRHSCDGILETNQTYIDDLIAGTHLSSGSRTPKPLRRHKEEKKAAKSNLSRVKAAVGAKLKTGSRRGSDASGMSTPRQEKKDAAVGTSDSNTIALYAEGNTNFYEREMKFYDSNSSLDVSSMCSAVHGMSKSMDSLRPTPEEFEGVNSNGTSFAQSPTAKVDGTDVSGRENDAEVARLHKVNDAYEKRIRDLEEQLTKARQISASTEKLQSSVEKSMDAQAAVAKEEFSRKQLEMESEIENVKQASAKFKTENDGLLQRLATEQQSSLDLKKRMKQHGESSAKIHDEKKALVDRVKTLHAENESLKTEVKKGKENESAIISQAKQKVIEAEQRCNQAEIRGTEAEQQFGAAESRVDEADRQCAVLRGKLAELERVCAEAEQGRKELESKVTRAEHELDEAEAGRESVEIKLGDVTKDKRKVEKEVKKLKKAVAKDEAELKKFKTDFDAVTTLLASAGLRGERKHESDKEEIGQLPNLKTDIKKLIRKLQAEEGQVNSAEAKKKVLEDQLNTSINEKDRKIDELQNRVKESQDALTKKAAECCRLDSELKHTKGQLVHLDAEKKKLEQEFGSERSRNQAELTQFQAAKAVQASEIARSRDEVSELRQQLDEVMNSLEKHREDSVPRDMYEADCARIAKDADILKKEVAKTMQKFAFVQMELANKEQEISDLRVERNQSEARSSKHEAEVTQLKSKCHETEVQVNVLRQQLTETKHKLDRVTEEVDGLRQSRRDTTIRLSAKQGEINESEKRKLESLRKQVENFSSHFQESEKRYRDTIAIYRGHLLSAVTGQLDSDVKQALQEILKLRGKGDEKQILHT